MHVLRVLGVVFLLSMGMSWTLAQGSVPLFKGRTQADSSVQRDFRLQDTKGRWRTLADFRGKVVLAFFGYTQCPDVCPTELARLAQLIAALGSDAARVQVVFVTLDPERDTAAVLRAYTSQFDPAIVPLRTDQQGTDAVARTFSVYYEKVPGRTPSTYTVDHSTLVYGFDTQGRLRVRLTPNQSPDDVLADVRTLLSIR
jgi:protein SCO1/2